MLRCWPSVDIVGTPVFNPELKMGMLISFWKFIQILVYLCINISSKEHIRSESWAWLHNVANYQDGRV